MPICERIAVKGLLRLHYYNVDAIKPERDLERVILQTCKGFHMSHLQSEDRRGSLQNVEIID